MPELHLRPQGGLTRAPQTNITLFTELCEKTRNDAFEMMVAPPRCCRG